MAAVTSPLAKTQLTPAVRRTLLVSVATAVAYAWILLQWAFRASAVPDGMAYVPPGHDSVILTGAIDLVWRGADLHFGEMIRDQARPDDKINSLRRMLKTAGVGSARDLTAYGVDVNRGAIFASYPSADRTLAVLPVDDHQRFIQLLVKSTEATQTQADPVRDVPVTAVGDLYVAAPQSGTVILSDDFTLVRVSLASRPSNLRYAKRNDALYEGLRLLGRRPLSGSSSLLVVPRSSAYLRNAWAVMHLTDDAVDIDVVSELQTVPWRVLTQFFRPPPGGTSWSRMLPESAAAAAVLQDRGIADYLRFFAKFSALGEILRDEYGGVLWALQEIRDLQRIAVVATGYRDGLPELMLGVWGDAADMERLILKLQTRFRIERDAFLLARAVAGLGERPARAQDLVSAGRLDDEPDSIFAQYTIGPYEIVAPTIDPLLFQTAAYSRRTDTGVVRYLMPPITSNDRRYRPQLTSSVPQDRYRIATTVARGAYWFATDADDLERLVSGRAPSLDRAADFSAATSTWTGNERLQIFVSLDRAIRLGLLSPESAIHASAKRYFWNLREHPGLSLAVETRQPRNRVRVRVRLPGRKALLQ